MEIPSASRIPRSAVHGRLRGLVTLGLEKVEAELHKVIEEVRSQALLDDVSDVNVMLVGIVGPTSLAKLMYQSLAVKASS